MNLTLLKTIGDALTSQYGVAGAVMTALCILVYRLIRKIIADKDEQIKQLAEENERYRVKFMSLLDKIHSIPAEAETKK